MGWPAAGALHASVRSPAELPVHPQAQHLGLFQALRQVGQGDLLYAASPWRCGSQAPGSPPRAGEHSIAILREAGLCEDEVSRLLAAAIIHQAAEVPVR